MKYIEKTLGIQVQYQSWENINKAPFFIIDRYEIQIAILGKIKTLFLHPKVEWEQINAIKKYVARIQKIECLPVVFIFDTISSYQKERLISQNIPFIVPEKQLYLPFMGIVLQENYSVAMEPVEQLQPSAQVLFLYYIYQNEKKLYMNQAMEALGYTAMTISRASRQLVQLGLFEEEKDGVTKVLKGKVDKKELFYQAEPYLINPVRKKIYVQNVVDIKGKCLAGISALSELSMLNPSKTICYAVDSKSHVSGTNQLIDAETQVEVEVWKYNPLILSKGKTVDVLSLALSLRDCEDERVEEAIEDVLNEMWEEM